MHESMQLVLQKITKSVKKNQKNLLILKEIF